MSPTVGTALSFSCVVWVRLGPIGPGTTLRSERGKPLTGRPESHPGGGGEAMGMGDGPEVEVILHDPSSVKFHKVSGRFKSSRYPVGVLVWWIFRSPCEVVD